MSRESITSKTAQDFIKENLHEIDFDFGYPSVLKARCIEKAEIIGSTWEEVIVEDYESDLIAMLDIS
jgi:hypothetical protein